MRWERIGRIYAPDGHREWMRSHASVPVAEFLSAHLVRIYFTSRDSYNRSHVGFLLIDMRQPLEVLDVSSEPVMRPGRLGAFDDSGAMLSWIAKGPSGDELAYYIGWNTGVTVPFRNAIGVARKREYAFTRVAEGPAIDRSFVDPYFTASCCVLVEGDLWRMWYLSATGWEMVGGKPRHSYLIKYAESSDGVAWRRDGRIAIGYVDANEYAISRPCVIKDKDRYRMWYSHRGARYAIGYAESPDGLVWTRLDHAAGIGCSSEGWDSEMIEYPFVFDYQGQRYMLYNGNGYGRTGFGIAVQTEN